MAAPVVKGFLELGFMKLGGVVVRVREYTPPATVLRGFAKGLAATQPRPTGLLAGGRAVSVQDESPIGGGPSQYPSFFTFMGVSGNNGIRK